MNAAVPPKMPKRALAAKNRISGPISSASLSIGIELGLRGHRHSACGSVSRRRPRSLISIPAIARAKSLRRERRQIVDAFAHADEMHRQPKFGRDGDQDAAARGAVELGHHEPRDAGDLAGTSRPARARSGRPWRRARAAPRAAPSGRPSSSRARSFPARPSARPGSAAGRRCRPAARRPLRRARCVSASKARPAASAPCARAITAAPLRVAPDLELLDRGGAERVAGGEHDRSALGAELGGELADGRGLARAVDADDQDHERLARRRSRAASPPAPGFSRSRRRAAPSPPRASLSIAALRPFWSAMRAATSMPRSARIRVSSISTMRSGDSRPAHEQVGHGGAERRRCPLAGRR